MVTEKIVPIIYLEIKYGINNWIRNCFQTLFPINILLAVIDFEVGKRIGTIDEKHSGMCPNS